MLPRRFRFATDAFTLGNANISGGTITLPRLRVDFPQEAARRFLFHGLHVDFIRSGTLKGTLTLLRDGSPADTFAFNLAAVEDTTVEEPVRWTLENCPFQYSGLASWANNAAGATLVDYATIPFLDPDTKFAYDGHQECFDYQFPDNTGAASGRKNIILTMFPMEVPGEYDGAIVDYSGTFTAQTVNAIPWAYARGVLGVRQFMP